MASQPSVTLKKADPKTIQDKFLVGYQGWFTCRGDGPPVHTGHPGWLHWFDRPDGGRPNMDLWPDVSAYSPSELFPAPGLTLPSGQPACLFSSRNARTVQRHFHWMAEHGIDGCFLQRFASQIEADGDQRGAKADLMRLRDEIGDRVREAAEKEGRVFAIMYDVSGVPADQLQKVLEVDWNHLIRDRALLDSPNYLREHGKPVVAIWGVGFAKNHHDPAVVTQIIRNMRSMTPGGAYIMAGTSTHWQTMDGDADSNPAFLNLYYNEFDAISPWTVGRYCDTDGADRFAAYRIKNDIDAIEKNCHGRKIDYISVVWPGGSEHHLSNKQREPNFAPREGGKFIWRQICNAKHYGVRVLYGAMWDEYDGGTALMPAEPYKRNVPNGGAFIALDVDGYDLPSDWYMRICGLAAEGLRGERRIHDTFPKKELDDYWSSRPKYVTYSAEASGSGSGSGFQDWLSAEKEKEKEEIPPPPYSLESSEPSSPSPATSDPVGPAHPPLPPRRSSSGPSQSLPSSVPKVPLANRPITNSQYATSNDNVSPIRVPSQVSQGSFVGGFGQAPGRNTESPRPIADASSTLVEEFHRHTLADHNTQINPLPSSPYASSPFVPAHSRPPFHYSPASSSSMNSWPQVQFPPSEWNTQKPHDTPDAGYPVPHLYTASPPPGNLSHPQDVPSQPSQGYPFPHSHYVGSSPPSVPPRQSYGPPNQSSPGAYSQPVGSSSWNNQPPYGHYGQYPAPQPIHDGHSPQQAQFEYGHPQQSPHMPTQSSPPPPIPPRPAPGTSNGAWSMVDRFTGRERRKKLEASLEQGVESVVQTGTKLLNQYKVPFK